VATGQTLSFDQIEQLWISNGGPAGWAPLMAAIAQAESSGSTVALNNNPGTGDYSVGLWQINYYAGLLGPRTNKYGSPAALQADPNLQAKAAIDLFANGAGWTNWENDHAINAWIAAGRPNQPNAATVQSWGFGGGGGGPSSTTTATGAAGGPAAGAPSGAVSNDLSTCVVQFPGFLFFSGPCLLTKGGVKWLSSVAALGVGAGMFTFGVLMLAAWGFDASGARQAVTSTAKKVGVGASLLTGQPEVAAGIAATSRRSSSSSPARPARAARPAGPATAGRLESRSIERRFQAAQRDIGPIGPRGANATSRRAYERRTSTPGSGRRPSTEQRRRVAETDEQRRARRRAEGFERVS
jgi:hypothetical protein